MTAGWMHIAPQTRTRFKVLSFDLDLGSIASWSALEERVAALEESGGTPGPPGPPGPPGSSEVSADAGNVLSLGGDGLAFYAGDSVDLASELAAIGAVQDQGDGALVFDGETGTIVFDRDVIA